MRFYIFAAALMIATMPGSEVSAQSRCANISPTRSIGGGCYEWRLANMCSRSIRIHFVNKEGRERSIPIDAGRATTHSCCDNPRFGKFCETQRFISVSYGR